MKSTLTSLLAVAFLPFTTLIAADPVIQIGEFTFTVNAPWEEAQNTGMMTKAVLAHPIKDSTPLEAKFYHFGSGQGGDADSNIKRWIGQFEGAPEVQQEELDINGTKVVLLTVTGTYLDGPPFGGAKTPKPDYQMLGAILVGKDAPVFIKLTGPKANTISIQDAYKKLALSPFNK